MLPMKFFIALIIIAVFGAAFVLLSSDLIPHNNIHGANPAVREVENSIELDNAGAGEILSATIEPVASSPNMSQADGLLLLENRCSKCHLTDEIKQFKKSRSDWELTLNQMESLGIQLSEDERTMLLDYLATDHIP